METQQSRALRMFTALRLLRADWSGALLVGVGLGEHGRAFALASLAAGAASLFLEEDRTNLRTATREGCCTFSVTTLDEALRALKNEVRQRHAISVALRSAPDLALRTMVERGVQPQYLAVTRTLSVEEGASADTLEQRGAGILAVEAEEPIARAVHLDPLLAAACAGRTLDLDAAQNLQLRRVQDKELFDAVEGGDALAAIQRDWLRAAPLLFPRALERAFWKHECGLTSRPLGTG